MQDFSKNDDVYTFRTDTNKCRGDNDGVICADSIQDYSASLWDGEVLFTSFTCNTGHKHTAKESDFSNYNRSIYKNVDLSCPH